MEEKAQYIAIPVKQEKENIESVNFNNIKSVFIKKKIFSFLYKRRELDIIIYNKNIQKQLDINLDIFKKISGKYKIAEKNGKGKEYSLNTKKLIFKGKYLNGKKNGIGEEYDYSKMCDCSKTLKMKALKSVCEYFNGKKRYGKEYDDFGILIYEGEYLNGKRKKGEEYYTYSYKTLLFKGEYLEGKRWNGKLYNKKGDLEFEIKNGKGEIKEYSYCNFKLLFEGEYSNGERKKGKEYYKLYKDRDKQKDELKFEGEFLNNEKYKGIEYHPNGKIKFEGEYKNGKMWTGKGYDKEGNFEFEIKEGNGKIKEYIIGYISIDNCNFYMIEKTEKEFIFEGEIKNGQKNGKGKEYYYEGKLIFEGEYINDKKNGKGKEYYYENNYIYKGTIIFEGEYLNGKRWNGKGKEYGWNGSLLFEGEYNNGLKNGKGEEYRCYSDGIGLKYEKVFEGEYLNGKRWKGEGKEYYENCDYEEILIFEGEYLNGKRWNGKGIEFEENFENINIIFDGEYVNGQKITIDVK